MIGLHEGKGAKVTKAVERTFTLKLSVVGCQPRVWRRIVVKDSMWLSRLHDTIQVAFDWFDYQTHTFSLEDLHFGNPLKTDGLIVEDDRDVPLADLDLQTRDHFIYDYNFGDPWRVEIKVEKSGHPEKGTKYPVCIGGERAGPPEDCGGLEAYHDMLASLKEPNTDLGREWIAWLGPEYNPAACDLVKINAALRKLKG